jgi:nuclear RNA export factor
VTSIKGEGSYYLFQAHIHDAGAIYSDMARRFTSLEMLDQEPIVGIAFDAPTASTSAAAPSIQRLSPTTFPNEMGSSFITGVDGSVVSRFLMKCVVFSVSIRRRALVSRIGFRFFPLFDTQRMALQEVYAPTATFSFSANTAIPVRARIQGLHSSKDLPNQRKLEWPAWLNGGKGGSRNLDRLRGGLDRVVNTLHVGSEAVMQAMMDLPGTKHDIGGPPDEFCVDAFPVPQGEVMNLLVSIHGRFAEGKFH